VSDEVRRLRTEEDVARFYRARRQGGECAACGRRFGEIETVYIERFEDARRRDGGLQSQGPVGAECASTWLLQRATNREAERCAGCLRPMYYGVEHKRRRQALCSQNCRHLAVKRRQDAARWNATARVLSAGCQDSGYPARAAGRHRDSTRGTVPSYG
jgi:hypothetical protein